MFYCSQCAARKGWPETLFRSKGKCETCGAKALCNERPSNLLPIPEEEVLDA